MFRVYVDLFRSWLSVPVQSVVWTLERLVSEMTYYVLSGTLNPTYSLSLDEVDAHQ